ncbi:gastrula zinc finger protein XlCGF48.2-like isoform X1 [Schistocerca nitens]|uniref:gastrula zinc finger protein XlCGF48.2-like isoform X1 n=2 Tax=Schistocerca TaxID=7008 RepID=UPI002117455C|nr:gastrula zinc finger protein XlCGF48.2-like isoform X1 [Schistocerca nitens]
MYTSNAVSFAGVSPQLLDGDSVLFRGISQWSPVVKARSFACARCHNAYTRRDNLMRHIRFECGVEPQFECPICYKKMKHKFSMIKHMKNHNRIRNLQQVNYLCESTVAGRRLCIVSRNFSMVSRCKSQKFYLCSLSQCLHPPTQPDASHSI